MIINNRPLTPLYPDATETPLTPNHLVFARMLNHSSLMTDPSIIKSLLKLKFKIKPFNGTLVGPLA